MDDLSKRKKNESLWLYMHTGYMYIVLITEMSSKLNLISLQQHVLTKVVYI